MVAELIFRSKFVYSDGAIREMVLWKLPKRTPANPHGFKYRLHYEHPDGRTYVRYDNEKGNGDHRHIGTHERNLTSLLTQKHLSQVSCRTLNAYEEVSREEKY